MSYVSIFAVRKDGLVQSVGTAGNNHGFAPLVWDYLVAKYKIPAANTFGLLMLDTTALLTLWAMFYPEGNGPLDALDNILLGATFDRVWIKTERLPLLFEAIERFNNEYVLPKRLVQTAINCLPVIRKALEEDPELAGICFNMCSANADYWYKRIPLGADGEPFVGNGAPVDWDNEPLNIFTDKSNGRDAGFHWEVGEHEQLAADPQGAPKS